MARTFEPTFSSTVKVTPTDHQLQLKMCLNRSSDLLSTSTELPGSGFSAAKHQPTSKTLNNRPTSTTKFPGTGSSAVKHQPTSQTQSSRPTSATKFPGTGFSAVKHQPTSQTKSSRPTPAEHTGTNPSAPKLQSTDKVKSHQLHADRPSATD